MLTLNQYSPSQVNFGVKVPTRDVISLATQRPLSEDFCGLLNSTNKITERQNNVHDLIACGEQCKNALLEQFPKLKEVSKNAEKFFKNKTRSTEETEAFVDKQIELMGSKELDVNPIQINETLYYDYESEIPRRKPLFGIISSK